MAQDKAFRCQLITPESAMVDIQATQVVLTAHDGELGVLRDRAPLLSMLGIGRCKIETQQQTDVYYIDGGFVQVLDNEMTVLTSRAINVKNIDVPAAEQELTTARQRSATTLQEVEARADDIKRASTKLLLAGQGS